METNISSYLTPEQPLSRIYRRASVIFGAVLIVFGAAGSAIPSLQIANEAGFGFSGPPSILLGSVLLYAAARGGAFASTTMSTIGSILLLLGLINLMVLIAASGTLGFDFPNGILSVLMGTSLLMTGGYGRFAGNLPDDNPWKRARAARQHI